MGRALGSLCATLSFGKAWALALFSQVVFRFADLGDDGFGRNGPGEGHGIFVPCIDVSGDGIDQLPDAGHGEAFQLPGREFAEEALHQIQPQRGR